MKCQTNAQVIARGDETVPEWEPALTHLAECPACQAEFRRGDPIDQQLATLTRDVPIPIGLEGRLVAALANTDISAPTPAVISPARGKVSRRRTLVASLVAACSVLVAAGYFFWADSQRVSVEQLKVVAQSPPDRQSLPTFSGFSRGVPLQLPQSIQIGSALDDLSAREFKIGRQKAAVYTFSFNTEHQLGIKGCLFAIPRSSTAGQLPAEGVPDIDATLAYPVAVWWEGDLVYVCCLTEGGGGETLERLFPQQQVM